SNALRTLVFPLACGPQMNMNMIYSPDPIMYLTLRPNDFRYFFTRSGMARPECVTLTNPCRISAS
ncbi:MAG: hypothetical protein II877_02725, partial [Synergistaceae bacterium]|nr:hypothetical protein [Synergistaceae bacterium]